MVQEEYCQADEELVRGSRKNQTLGHRLFSPISLKDVLHDNCLPNLNLLGHSHHGYLPRYAGRGIYSASLCGKWKLDISYLLYTCWSGLDYDCTERSTFVFLSATCNGVDHLGLLHSSSLDLPVTASV